MFSRVTFSRSIARRAALAAAVLGVGAFAASSAHAQGGGGGGGNNTPPLAGVVVDAQGVLRTQVFADPTGALRRERFEASKATLNPKIMAQSPLRKISLSRLEKAVAAQLEAGRQPTDEMKCLAGLTRIKYVFYYPESKDIVIAGPAEGWMRDVTDRPVTMRGGRAVLELQDLVVALRAYGPDNKAEPFIGCSIDPTPAGLKAMQQFLRQFGSVATPADTQNIVQGLRNSLGLQNVTVHGVAADTHFAQVMVEADYRMKLIGIGLERPPVKVVSFIDRASTAQSKNALRRWYFVPDYQCVRVTEDKLGMQLVGEGVKLVGENEVVSHEGQRAAAGRGDMASQAFVTSFTKMYPELAARVAVYAQLRNLVDMSVAAAFIQQQGYYAKADWKMPLFGSEEKYKVQTYPTPAHVEPMVSSVWKGRTLMTPIGGGVSMEAHRALESQNLLTDEKGETAKTREDVKLKDLAAGQWWWD